MSRQKPNQDPPSEAVAHLWQYVRVGDRLYTAERTTERGKKGRAMCVSVLAFQNDPCHSIPSKHDVVDVTQQVAAVLGVPYNRDGTLTLSQNELNPDEDRIQKAIERLDEILFAEKGPRRDRLRYKPLWGAPRRPRLPE